MKRPETFEKRAVPERRCRGAFGPRRTNGRRLVGKREYRALHWLKLNQNRGVKAV
jgi:hypothetical protein